MSQNAFAEAPQGTAGQRPEFAGDDFPPCLFCRHLREAGTQDGGGWTCRAFPQRIPGVILARQRDHTAAHPGGSGLRYEPVMLADASDRYYTVDWDGMRHYLERGAAD